MHAQQQQKSAPLLLLLEPITHPASAPPWRTLPAADPCNNESWELEHTITNHRQLPAPSKCKCKNDKGLTPAVKQTTAAAAV